jgi:anti-sigma B factor antagonist
MRGNGQSGFDDERVQAPADAGSSRGAGAGSPGAASRAATEEQKSPEGVAFAIAERAMPAATSLVTVEGELDLASAPSLKRALSDVLASGTQRIVVDLGPVTFIDSTALGVLVGIHRKLDTDVRMALAGAGTEVMNIFELTGLDATFDMFATVDEALVWVRRNEAPTG